MRLATRASSLAAVGSFIVSEGPLDGPDGKINTSAQDGDQKNGGDDFHSPGD